MSTEYFGRNDMPETEEYCAQHGCKRSGGCRHYKAAQRLSPERAFRMHGIEESECGPGNEYIRYWPTEEAKRASR